MPPKKKAAAAPAVATIGTLLVEAETKAAKKASKTHTAEAPCHCRVTVSFFTDDSSSAKIERCSEHPKPGASLQIQTKRGQR